MLAAQGKQGTIKASWKGARFTERNSKNLFRFFLQLPWVHAVPYHKMSLHNLKFRVHKTPLRQEVELRIAPDEEIGMAEVRIWYKDILTDVYQVKNI